MTHKDPGRWSPFFAMALFTLLLCCILGLVILGSGLYGSLVESQAANNSARASLRYLATSVRAADRENAVAIRPGPEGDALILTDPDSGYETRIYLLGGQLVEEFSPAGSDFLPENGQPITSCQQFDPQFVSPQLLQVETDEGTVRIALRSAQGGSQ